MKNFELSRRTFIKYSLGTIGLGGLSHFGYTTFNIEDFLSTTLHRLLGQYTITDEHMRSFCNDFSDVYGRRNIYAIICLKQTSVFDRIAEKFFNLQARWVIEKFERKLLTQFIISTSYLRVNSPAVDAIDYYGMNIPCNNPFAQFDFVMPPPSG